MEKAVMTKRVSLVAGTIQRRVQIEDLEVDKWYEDYRNKSNLMVREQKILAFESIGILDEDSCICNPIRYYITPYHEYNKVFFSQPSEQADSYSKPNFARN